MKINRKFITVILVSLLLLLNIPLVFADDLDLPEPSHEFYVYDEVGVINSSIKDYIVQINEELFSKTGVQVVVAVVSNLQDYNIEEYANRLFRKWGVGSKNENNGILLLVSISDRKVWIEVGYGLEGALPDGKAGEILDKDVIPYFQQESYGEGILQGFNSILSIIENEYNVQIDRDRPINYNTQNNVIQKQSPFDSFRKILIAIAVIIFIFIDFKFFGGLLTYSILRSVSRGSFRGGGSGGNRGGGGSSGGGGAGRGW